MIQHRNRVVDKLRDGDGPLSRRRRGAALLIARHAQLSVPSREDLVAERGRVVADSRTTMQDER